MVNPAQLPPIRTTEEHKMHPQKNPVSAFQQMMDLSANLPQLFQYHVVVPNQYNNPKYVILSDPINQGSIITSIDITIYNPTHTYTWIRTNSDEYLITVKSEEGDILLSDAKIKMIAGQTLRIIFKIDGSYSIRILNPILLT